MDANIFTTLASAVGVLAGVYAIVNRTEDRIGKRFDDMKDLWRAELRRVEEVLDTRLKHMEEDR